MEAGTCPSCGTQNPASARFCMECGGQLERRCSACGAAAPPQARFCMECGASFEPAAEPAAPASPGFPSPAAASPGFPSAAADAPPEERRQVTVLFADLSGYTAVSERMDPERVKALVENALRRLAEEVDRFGGTVDKFIGDNVMALFGAPVAHEDDAERAVRAGLGMQQAMGEINEQLAESHDVTLALRVGVNTGEVVAGAVGDAYTVVGDTVNVAARLQAAAQRGSVTVGERTMRASARAVDYRELAPLTLKGKGEPVPAWEAIGATGATPTRRSAAARSPLVGRTHELQLLESLAQRVGREGRPHIVTIVGEAGVGKSRLLAELERRLGDGADGPAFRTGRCPAYGAAVVYWALAEVLREEFAIDDSDSAEVAWRKLADGVAARLAETDASDDAVRHAATIARLLGIGSSEAPALAGDDDPQRLRESFFAAIRALVEAIAEGRPLVVALEDIHWADDGMLDLIEHLAQWVRAPLLLLCLTRDELLERRSDWGSGRRNATTLGLEPLTGEEAHELVAALLSASNGDAASAVSLIAERSEGNPLFAEEMVQRLAEGSEDEELPDTVQGVLAARLDSLPPFERKLVQHAAVSGRTFWPGSLASIAQEEGADLAAALRSLQDKELVIQSRGGGGLEGEREFAFKHVLIRDVAYGMLPKAVRAHRHFEVARYVEERAGDRTDEVVALLAEHYGRAASLAQEARLDRPVREQLNAKAFDVLEAAGDAATALYSNGEAFDHYGAACALEGADDASRARVREKQGDVALLLGRVDAAATAWEECLEFQRREENLPRLGDLNRKLAGALWQKGALKEAIERYQRGIGVLKDGPPSAELVRLYEEAATLYMHTGDNMLAIYAAEKALRLAERLEEAAAASRAHEVFGRVFGRTGDNAKARENLERSVELARSSGPTDTIRALIALGSHLDMSEADYAGAAAAYSEARELADRVGDLTAAAELDSALALLAAYRADWDAVEAYARASLELAEREGLVRNTAYPYALQGLLHWRVGDFRQAEDTYRRALRIAEETGWSEVAYWALYGMSLALRDAGDVGGALTALAQALDVCERAGLVAQSIQATAARAVNLALDGKRDQALGFADEAARLAERLPYPVGRAASLEATGVCADGVDAAIVALGEARELWTALGRPLDAAWCDVLTA
ncbi:MAG TPA: adenylate/guanylate cyclase domain-containing protein, partial [Thermoleophilaceae bacterium]|nr:adenylate/guanylate cyclase domain-containing protein [Thermoleophilaceae bacterium]